MICVNDLLQPFKSAEQGQSIEAPGAWLIALYEMNIAENACPGNTRASGQRVVRRRVAALLQKSLLEAKPGTYVLFHPLDVAFDIQKR
jgi:hypothetical protein